jgi:GST-like protein
MIDLYYTPTPNTWKISIMLEECGLPYRTLPIDISANEQKKPDFLAINPNGRVPAIVDPEGPEGPQAVFESGAILIYLAEKTGRFLAPKGRARVETLEWLMWQMGGLGPMAGQAHHFLRMAPPGNDYGIQRYVNESKRLYGVLDKRLSESEYLSSGGYSIADMACWGWVWFHPMHLQQTFDDFPSVKRWYFAIAARPAVKRGQAVGIERVAEPMRTNFKRRFYDAPDV